MQIHAIIEFPHYMQLQFSGSSIHLSIGIMEILSKFLEQNLFLGSEETKYEVGWPFIYKFFKIYLLIYFSIYCLIHLLNKCIS